MFRLHAVSVIPADHEEMRPFRHHRPLLDGIPIRAAEPAVGSDARSIQGHSC